jgi:hypothetical protein
MSLPCAHSCKVISCGGNAKPIGQIAITVKPYALPGIFLPPTLTVAAAVPGGQISGEYSPGQTYTSELIGIPGTLYGGGHT